MAERDRMTLGDGANLAAGACLFIVLAGAFVFIALPLLVVFLGAILASLGA